MKKSTRAIPSHSVAMNESTASACTRSACASGIRAGTTMSEPPRLHEDGKRERVVDLVALAKRHVARDGDAAVAQHGLAEILVHAERGGGDACADVGNSRELEQPLDGAVLAEGPVEDREHDV